MVKHLFTSIVMLAAMALQGHSTTITMQNLVIDTGGEAAATISISPEAADNYQIAGLQFDLLLPQYLSVAELTPTGSYASFTVKSYEHTDGAVRVVMYGDRGNATLEAGPAIIITFRCTEGTPSSGNIITINKAMVSTHDARDIPIDDTTANVTVVVPTGSIVLSDYVLTLLVGQTNKLNATVEPENATDKTVTWTSDNEAVATVAADGTITAVSVGSATITATCGEATATCKVTVKGSDIITVTPGEGGDDEDWLDGSNVSVHVDQSVTVEVTLSENLSTQPQFVWALADGGSTFVKFTPADDTLSATFIGLSVGNTSYTIGIGDKVLAGGTVTVTAPVDDEFELTFGDADIDVDGVTILMGETFTLTPKAKEGYVLPTNITWTSSADQIASVDDAGVVTGVAVGTADITASATVNGQTVSATCKVTVKGSDIITVTPGEGGDDEDWLDGSNVSVHVDQSVTVEVTLSENLSTLPQLVWALADGGGTFVKLTPADDTLSATFTGLSVGNTSYTISIGDKVLAGGTVTVTAPVDDEFELTFGDAAIDVDGVTILLGETFTLTPKAKEGYVLPTNITWTSSADQIASVDNDGVVTGVAVGTADITASATVNGQTVSATCKVTVKGSDIITVTPGEGGDDEDWLDGSNVSVHVDQSVTVEVTLSENLSTLPQLVWALADGGSTFVKLTPAEDTLSATFTGLSVGNTSYTIGIGDKVLAGGTVTVTAPVDDEFELTFGDAAIDVDGVTILLGETFTLTPKAKEGYVLPTNISWSSSADQIASVDDAGVVTGLAVGTADITASATVNGQTVSATCKVTVKDKYDSVALIWQDEALSADATANVYTPAGSLIRILDIPAGTKLSGVIGRHTLEPGTYIVHIISGATTLTRKIVIR